MYSESEIENIYLGFKNKSLPKIEWTHKAHIIVAACFLFDHSLENAVPLIREGIKEYNVASGGVNNDIDGYHETITMFWIAKVDEFIKINSHIKDKVTMLNSMLDGEFGNTNYPLVYYSKDFLMSTMARKMFLPPNVKMMWLPDNLG